MHGKFDLFQDAAILYGMILKVIYWADNTSQFVKGKHDECNMEVGFMNNIIVNCHNYCMPIDV
jgi:hypothetical protein